MPDELDERLRRLRRSVGPQKKQDAGPQENIPLKKMDEGRTMDVIEINQFREPLDRGAVLQVYKKDDRLVMEISPVVNRWLWYAIILDGVLFALLLTKVIRLW